MIRTVDRNGWTSRFKVGTTFDCWESFKDALEQYSLTHHVQFACVNSRTVAAANRLHSNAGKPGKAYANGIKYSYGGEFLWSVAGANPLILERVFT